MINQILTATNLPETRDKKISAENSFFWMDSFRAFKRSILDMVTWLEKINKLLMKVGTVK